MLDSQSFLVGFLACMIADVFFSIANFFLQRAFKEREIRRSLKEENKSE